MVGMSVQILVVSKEMIRVVKMVWMMVSLLVYTLVD